MENNNKTLISVEEEVNEFELESRVEQKELEDMIDNHLKLENRLYELDLEDITPEEIEENTEILLNAA